MVKTVWHCDDCGEAFNSRAARLYHRNHTCPKIKNDEEKTEGKEDVPDDFQVSPKTESTSEKGDESARAVIPTKTGDDVTEAQETTNEQRELGTGYLIVSDSDEPAKGDDIPFILIIPIILFIALAAGFLLFRDKIMAFFRRPPQPPAAIADMGFA